MDPQGELDGESSRPKAVGRLLNQHNCEELGVCIQIFPGMAPHFVTLSWSNPGQAIESACSEIPSPGLGKVW